MAFDQPFETKQGPLKNSVTGNGFGSVVRAGRVKAAPRANQGRYEKLITPDHQQDDPGCGPLHALRQFGRKAFQDLSLIRYGLRARQRFAQ